jgi:hypothetical protein
MDRRPRPGNEDECRRRAEVEDVADVQRCPIGEPEFNHGTLPWPAGHISFTSAGRTVM